MRQFHNEEQFKLFGYVYQVHSRGGPCYAVGLHGDSSEDSVAGHTKGVRTAQGNISLPIGNPFCPVKNYSHGNYHDNHLKHCAITIYGYFAEGMWPEARNLKDLGRLLNVLLSVDALRRHYAEG